MAKYEDYVKKADDLQDEIDTAADQSTDRRESDPETQFELPEQFRGKSPEDIAKSYTELQRAYSRQGNDLGEMRKTLDEFIRLNSTPDTSKPDPSDAKPVSIDDLYTDAEEAISRVVTKRTDSRIVELEKELANARLQVRVDSLESKFPGWKDSTQKPEFINWVQDSPYRMRLAQAADGYDMDAAEELLGLYQEVSTARSQERKSQRKQDLRKATLESAGPDSPDPETRYSRTDIINARIKAKRGDVEATNWLASHGDAIAFAYEDGRIDD